MRNFNSEVKPASLETTKDGARVDLIVFIHLSHFEPQVVLGWLRRVCSQGEGAPREPESRA